MIVRERMQDLLMKPQNVQKVSTELIRSFGEHERDKEHFFSFGLDSRNQIVFVDLVSVGTLNYNLVHPREVFRMAIMKAVASIVVCHNHPSGSLEPSDEDLSLTKRLAQAGKILGIEVLDHVITTDEGYYSFKQKGVCL